MDAFTRFFIKTLLDVLFIAFDGNLQQAADILDALVKDYRAHLTKA